MALEQPSLTPLSQVLPRKSHGTRSSIRLRGTDRWALKSSFFNAGSRLAPAQTMAASRISMRVATNKAYICSDCGYIYNDRTPFSKLPNDYSCPVCLAPKRRFKPYGEPVARNANSTDVRKARKEQLKKANSNLGSALPVAIAVGLAILAGTYFYLNIQY
ncbi:hypothetical protein SELMODRAFT_146861 [Selaginella moellendorffii]|uniref:Rubredoxin-like domain-containing protein n=2 Tax=Selaginella moellendorffii TaxID=88036 RepID=D8RG26_SELML|nr:uncharacterized protein LOC9646272 [Selaginella moellendorffii]EFJ28968.1 hypothetical protein SELMODRAFT_146861 [Selaginella moellendorffii]|eukprot:XP_002969844.1 uncharacterized protein LOC9646272 [Selaginella moellendorffii]